MPLETPDSPERREPHLWLSRTRPPGEGSSATIVTLRVAERESAEVECELREQQRKADKAFRLARLRSEEDEAATAAPSSLPGIELAKTEETNFLFLSLSVLLRNEAQS